MIRKKEVVIIKNAEEIIKDGRKRAGEYYTSIGVVILEMGSVWKYMHEAWLIKGFTEGVLGITAYDQVVCLGREYEFEEVVGKQKGKSITRRSKQLDISRFIDFYDRYEKWKYAQEKEAEANKALAVQVVL